MGYEGSVGLTIAFVVVLIVWYQCILHPDIHPLIKLLSYLQVAMPLWHVINGEQHWSDGALGGVDSYEVTLTYCSVMYCVVLWYTGQDCWYIYIAMALVIGGGLYAKEGWHGIAIAEVVCGLVAWVLLGITLDSRSTL